MLTIATTRYAAREKVVAPGLAPVRTTVGRPRFRLGYELAGNFAAYSTFHAARAACQIFGWRERSELAELLAACAAEMDGASADATV